MLILEPNGQLDRPARSRRLPLRAFWAKLARLLRR
jgi:hypothetical protein